MRKEQPPPSSPEVSRRMSNAKTRDTAPEMAVRRELHARGFRYRVDAPLPGMPRRRADLLFARERVAVFVDGCFWHGCDLHGVSPRANGDWWAEKLRGNRARDIETDRRLDEQGWESIRCWEHEDAVDAANRVERVLIARRHTQMG